MTHPSSNQPRVPKGTPTKGGQFDFKHNPAADPRVQLSDVEFAEPPAGIDPRDLAHAIYVEDRPWDVDAVANRDGWSAGAWDKFYEIADEYRPDDDDSGSGSGGIEPPPLSTQSRERSGPSEQPSADGVTQEQIDEFHAKMRSGKPFALPPKGHPLYKHVNPGKIRVAARAATKRAAAESLASQKERMEQARGISRMSRR